MKRRFAPDRQRARAHYERLASLTHGSNGARPELQRLREQIAKN